MAENCYEDLARAQGGKCLKEERMATETYKIANQGGPDAQTVDGGQPGNTDILK